MWSEHWVEETLGGVDTGMGGRKAKPIGPLGVCIGLAIQEAQSGTSLAAFRVRRHGCEVTACRSFLAIRGRDGASARTGSDPSLELALVLPNPFPFAEMNH